MDNQRQTGRTTRMLEKAHKEVQNGEYVVIVGANLEQAKVLKSYYERLFGDLPLINPRIDFVGLSQKEHLKGVPYTVLLKDHYAIECELAATPKKESCPVCSGRGKVRDTSYDNPDPGSGYAKMMSLLSNVLEAEKQCPRCEGTGLVAAAKPSSVLVLDPAPYIDLTE